MGILLMHPGLLYLCSLYMSEFLVGVCVLKEERKGKETEKETFAYVWTNFSVSCESFFFLLLANSLSAKAQL